MYNIVRSILDNALVQPPDIVLHSSLSFNQCHLLSPEEKEKDLSQCQYVLAP